MADLFKSVGDELYQFRFNILIVEGGRAQHLQGASVFVYEGEEKTEKVVIDLKGVFFCCHPVC